MSCLDKCLDNWRSKYAVDRPLRLLAFDGRGILGIVSLETAGLIETQFAADTGKAVAFRLGGVFDYIAETSMGHHRG